MSFPVRLENVRKTYSRGVVALGGVTVDFPAGTMTAVMGPSSTARSSTASRTRRWSRSPPS